MKKYISIGLCNLIDTIATLYLCRTCAFLEVNPFMAILLQRPVMFAMVKIILISAVLIRLWYSQEDKKAQVAVNIGCWMYGLIASYYVAICAILLIN